MVASPSSLRDRLLLLLEAVVLAALSLPARLCLHCGLDSWLPLAPALASLPPSPPGPGVGGSSSSSIPLH